jgi:hypothetical protein
MLIDQRDDDLREGENWIGNWKVGFLEAQISYFQHFEEFSNKKLTLR